MQSERLRKPPKADVDNLKAEVVVLIVETDASQIDVVVFSIRLEFRGRAQRVVGFLDLPGLEIGFRDQVIEFRAAHSWLLEELFRNLDGNGRLTPADQHECLV